jgi:hypothetical protein
VFDGESARPPDVPLCTTLAEIGASQGNKFMPASADTS